MNILLEELSEKLSNLTILEATELVKILEKKWGISANNFNKLSNEQNGEKKEEEKKEIKTEFDVILVDTGEKKIQVVKVLREITGLGLKESKDMVDKLPSTVKSKINKADADSIKIKLEEQGAKIEIK